MRRRDLVALLVTCQLCVQGCRRVDSHAASRETGGHAEPRLLRLETSETVSRIALPAGTVVLQASEAASIEAPFALHAEATAASGVAVVLPEGAGSPAQQGAARFTVPIERPGRYLAWARARWDNSCGNSFELQVDVEEYSDWYGWGRSPSHVHYPVDNICVVLAVGENPAQGYRLEVNARKRTRSVLYRNGVEVASVPQDQHFPLHYVGGHAPYEPRHSRITMRKRGAEVVVIINGRRVLAFVDPDPLPVSRVGIGGYRTHINFSNIELCELR